MKTKIKDALIKKGLKQIDVCTALGISKNNLSNWITGRYEPNLETLVKIADFLNVSVDALLGRERITISISPEDYKELLNCKKVLNKIILEIPEMRKF